MKILQIFFLVLSFAVTGLADIPPMGDRRHPDQRPISQPTPEEKKQDETRTCAGAIMLTIGIFLLGQWLLRRSDWQIAQPAELQRN